MEKDKITKKIMSFLTMVENFYDRLNALLPESDLKKRIISSVILLTIAIYAIFFSKALFFLIVIALTILISFEWLDIIKSAQNQSKWRIIGFLYILIPVWSILKIWDFEPRVLLWMFFIIWTTDITAYFVGRAFGGPKLMPKVSPNKTWSGLGGAVVASMIIGFLSSFIIASGSIIFFILVSGILSVIEQMSDLVESKIKRTFNVKDSGSIIPGHGGFLDRLDGITLVAPTVLMLTVIFSDKF